MMDNSDAALVRAVKDGDFDSYGELAQRYHHILTAIAYAATGEYHLAEDAVQETLARALVNLPRLNQDEHFGPWLTRICRNVATDMSRVKYRRPQELPDIAAPADKPDEPARLVREAISKLHPAARELIVLRYYDNLAYEQMGHVLNLTTAAVKARLSRTKKRLGKLLCRLGLLENWP